MFVSVEGEACGQNVLNVEEMISESSVSTDVNVVRQGESEPAISDLQEEVCALRLKHRYLDDKRRESLNKILDIKGSIRVFCRVRPSLPQDKWRAQSPVSLDSEKVFVTSSGCKKEFYVDKVFSSDSEQEDVFVEVQPILRSALDGLNVVVFAYGHTGTGKTFTMEGTPERPGIVPRAIKELFRQVSLEETSSSYTLSLSMLEVYMGNLRDLLAPKIVTNMSTTSSAKSNLNIQISSTSNVEVEGLTDVPVEDFKQAYRWYSRGKRARSTSWTNVNEASSRSHCLTRITVGRLREGKKIYSKLWMVDLGGSERLLKTGATGQTMDEGKAINLSLSSLADVIAALKRKRHHIPYRNSKLTQILSDSLGDGSKVLMLVHISPSDDDIGETICSLNFAKRARASEFSREISNDTKYRKDEHIRDLNQQMKETEEEMQKVSSRIRETEQILCRILEDQKGSPRSPLIIGCGYALESSPKGAEKTSTKSCSNSLPRFMTSTACSRHRQSASAEIKAVRSITRSMISSAVTQSQSFSSSIPRSLPETTRITKLKPFSSQSLDMRTSLPSRMGRLSKSQSTMRAALALNNRRMSNLI